MIELKRNMQQCKFLTLNVVKEPAADNDIER